MFYIRGVKISHLSTRRGLATIAAVLLLGLLSGIEVSSANIAVAPIFSDNAVLQQGMLVPVFGTAPAGTEVTVTFGNAPCEGNQCTVTADSSNKWRVNLDTSSYTSSDSDYMTITDGTETITLEGLQVGEVWVCSGQSNMLFKLSNAEGGAVAVDEAGTHNIRLFLIPSTGGPDGVTWQVSDSTTAGNFSAVCYFFGRELAQHLARLIVPVRKHRAIETLFEQSIRV